MRKQLSLALLGDFSGEHFDLAALCRAEGWTTSAGAPDQADAAILDLPADDVAPLFHCANRHPDLLLIVSCRFRSHLDWPILHSQGAALMLHRPFAEAEIRQSLGFLAQTLERRTQTVRAIAG